MKNYLLTGATKGLGLEIAKSIMNLGDDTVVYGLNRTNTDEYIALATAYPNRVHFLGYDLSNVDGLKQQVFKDYLGKQVAIHGYINNAALAYDDIVTNMQLEPLERMYRVNVFAPMMMTKWVLRNMLLHKTVGSIVHISSISVHTGYKGLAMYASTKGALEAFSKNTAREWGSLGIRSNAVVAGFMETSMSANLDPDQKSRIYKRTSLKEATSKKSVAEMVACLLSDAAKSVTGQNIHVDAGTI
jgi:3-oxoacyl-[acyl-carrier protein] reductase